MRRPARRCGARRIRLVVALVGLWALPATAHAHLVNSGMGPFYDGVLHLMVSPGELLGLITLALWAGLVGEGASRLTVLLLPAAWMLGGLVSLGLSWELSSELPGAVSLVALGAMVAMDAKLPSSAVALLAGLYGGGHGLLNGSALAASDAGWPAVIGIGVAAGLIALLVTAAVVSLRHAWMRIAVRVAGSWMAAVGLLMLGWMARGSG